MTCLQKKSQNVGFVFLVILIENIKRKQITKQILPALIYLFFKCGSFIDILTRLWERVDRHLQLFYLPPPPHSTSSLISLIMQRSYRVFKIFILCDRKPILKKETVVIVHTICLLWLHNFATCALSCNFTWEQNPIS